MSEVKHTGITFMCS